MDFPSACRRPARGLVIRVAGVGLAILVSACGAERFPGLSSDAGPPASPDVAPPTEDADDDGGAGGEGGAVSDPDAGSGGTGSGGAPGTGGMVPVGDAGSGARGSLDAPVDTGGPEGPVDAPPVTYRAALTGEHATMLAGNAAGGGVGQDSCPAGQALVGFTGSLSMATAAMAVHRQIAAHCGVIAVAGTTVTVKPGATLTTRGMGGLLAWTSTCPANQVVVGFSGHAGTLVDQLVFICAPLTVASAAVGAPLMSGAETSLAPVGGTGGISFAAIKCPAGEIGAGSLVRTGTEMDGFSILCSKAALTP